MAENRIRIRKRDRVLRQILLNTRVYGHSTAGGGISSDSTTFGTANSWMRREWMEDVNHKEHYTLRVIGEKIDHSTLIGTMSRRDRGSPMWLRRVERRWPASSVGPFKRTQGIPIAGQGNWSVTTIGGAQICGSGAQYTTSPVTPVATYPAVPAKSVINFDYYSPKGWKKFQPLNPKVSTTQFIGELRDLPHLVSGLFRKAGFFRTLGEEYLRYEFGWKPFVQDLKSFFELYFSFNERYEQLVRDNGKPVRRKGAIFSDIDTSSTPLEISGAGVDWNTPVLQTWCYGGSSGFTSSRSTTTTVEQKYWFSAAFRYYLAPMGSTRFNEQIARIIYGVDFSPRVAYELLPWSWLLDWATNVGDNISNFTETFADGLVADYAYCMGHYRMTSQLTTFGPLSTCNYYEISEVKARDQATPYGFGLATSDFTVRQKAILAALFLARS